MDIFDTIEQRIIARRGQPGFENIGYPDPRNPGAYHVELTPGYYIGSLTGNAHASVNRPAVASAMTPAYAALVERSEQLHKRLGDIAYELIALKVPTAPTWERIAALTAGKGYAAPDVADVESRAKALDLEAQEIAMALPQLVAQAREQASKDAATMLATAEAAYAAADSAYAKVEAAARAKREAAEAAYAAALEECEAMQVATRDAFTGAAWSLAWAEGLPNTASDALQPENRRDQAKRTGVPRAMELETTARPSANPAPVVVPEPTEEELQIAAAEASWKALGLDPRPGIR